MTKQELDAAFNVAFRKQRRALSEVDGEYLDHDRRQRAYAALADVNAELNRLYDIENAQASGALQGGGTQQDV